MSYVDDEFYSELVKSFSDWQRTDLEVAELQVREQCRMVLEREARLLDQGRYKEWLELYAERCVVWGPGSEQAGYPRREVTVFFDDRQRLQDRIYRLGTGQAWSQGPPSPTRRPGSKVHTLRTQGRTRAIVP